MWTLTNGETVTIACTSSGTCQQGEVTGNSLRIGDIFLPHLSDFEYDPGTKKVKLRSLLIAELNDTPDLALRRVNGSEASPSAVLPNELVGVLYWQPYGTNGSYDASVQSPFYGRIGQIQARAFGQQTSTSRAGRLAFATGRPNDTVIRERAFIDEQGRWIVLGRASVEDGQLDSTMATDSFGWMTVLAPRTEVGPAWSMRFASNPLYGFDFDLNASTGALELYSVRNGARRLIQTWPY